MQVRERKKEESRMRKGGEDRRGWCRQRLERGERKRGCKISKRGEREKGGELRKGREGNRGEGIKGEAREEILLVLANVIWGRTEEREEEDVDIEKGDYGERKSHSPLCCTLRILHSQFSRPFFSTFSFHWFSLILPTVRAYFLPLLPLSCSLSPSLSLSVYLSISPSPYLPACLPALLQTRHTQAHIHTQHLHTTSCLKSSLIFGSGCGILLPGSQHTGAPLPNVSNFINMFLPPTPAKVFEWMNEWMYE